MIRSRQSENLFQLESERVHIDPDVDSLQVAFGKRLRIEDDNQIFDRPLGPKKRRRRLEDDDVWTKYREPVNDSDDSDETSSTSSRLRKRRVSEINNEKLNNSSNNPYIQSDPYIQLDPYIQSDNQIIKRIRTNDFYDPNKLDLSRFHISDFSHDFWDLAPHMLPYLLFRHLDLKSFWTMRLINKKCLRAVKLYEQQFYPQLHKFFLKYRLYDLLPTRCSCEQCTWRRMRLWFWKVLHICYDLEQSTWSTAVDRMAGSIGLQLLKQYQKHEMIRKTEFPLVIHSPEIPHEFD